MTPAIVSLAFNATLAVLLIITIGYCYKLNVKIRQLQDGRSELASMIALFDKSTERATASLTELQGVSKKITEALQLKIDKANFLADDLAFLIEKSTKLTNQLEQQLKQRNETLRPQAPGVTSHGPSFTSSSTAQEVQATTKTTATRSGIEQLLAASGQSQQGPSVASIEAMLQKLSNPPPAKRPVVQEEPAARTDAERELINALKAGRG